MSIQHDESIVCRGLKVQGWISDIMINNPTVDPKCGLKVQGWISDIIINGLIEPF